MQNLEGDLVGWLSHLKRPITCYPMDNQLKTSIRLGKSQGKLETEVPIIVWIDSSSFLVFLCAFSESIAAGAARFCSTSFYRKEADWSQSPTENTPSEAGKMDDQVETRVTELPPNSCREIVGLKVFVLLPLFTFVLTRGVTCEGQRWWLSNSLFHLDNWPTVLINGSPIKHTHAHVQTFPTSTCVQDSHLRWRDCRPSWGRSDDFYQARYCHIFFGEERSSISELMYSTTHTGSWLWPSLSNCHSKWICCASRTVLCMRNEELYHWLWRVSSSECHCQASSEVRDSFPRPRTSQLCSCKSGPYRADLRLKSNYSWNT